MAGGGEGDGMLMGGAGSGERGKARRLGGGEPPMPLELLLLSTMQCCVLPRSCGGTHSRECRQPWEPPLSPCTSTRTPRSSSLPPTPPALAANTTDACYSDPSNPDCAAFERSDDGGWHTQVHVLWDAFARRQLREGPP